MNDDQEIMLTVGQLKAMLFEQSRQTLLCVVDSNLQLPKPHHRNQPIMSVIMQLEAIYATRH